MGEIVMATLLLLLLVAAAVLGAAEAALLRVPAARVRVQAERGDHKAMLLSRLIDDLPRTLNTVLLVVLLIQVTAATVAASLASRLLGDAGASVAAGVLTVLLFVYGEAIPKTYAVRHPEAVARRTARLLATLRAVLRPVVSALVWLADLQAPGVGIAAPGTITEEEILHLVSEAAREGEIEPVEREFIERVLALDEARVADVMVPRVDVVWVDRRTPAAEALTTALDAGHRRLLVCDGDLDDVLGVVRLESLARVADRTTPVAALVEPVMFVPESRRVVDLLREMQRQDRHLAVVVDEHGGTEGIVTIDDIAAEVLGRVSDEGEGLAPQIVSLGPGRWRIDAGMDADDAATATGVEFPEGPWRTVGGMVMALAGRIPDRGDRIELPDAVIEVVDADRNRVATVELISRNAAHR